MNGSEIKQLVERALADGKLTRQELTEILNAMTSDHKISDPERELLESIQRQIKSGQVTIEDLEDHDVDLEIEIAQME